MNLIIDGPNESGKSFLSEEILQGFDIEKSSLVDEPTMREMIQTPTLFMRALIKNLDTNFISVWSRGWISEIVKLKMDGVEVDEFAWEFLLRRVSINRGDYFVLLPETKELYFKQFSEDEFADSFAEKEDLSLEYDLFLDYAQRWDYKIIYTDYSPENMKELSRVCRLAAITENHAFSSEQYIGISFPEISFVGNSFQEFAFSPRPFHSLNDMEYFRIFGKDAILNFGYSPLQDFIEIRESKWGKLLRNPVMIGSRAQEFYPVFEAAEMVFGERDAIQIQKFKQDVFGILERGFKGASR